MAVNFLGSFILRNFELQSRHLECLETLVLGNINTFYQSMMTVDLGCNFLSSLFFVFLNNVSYISKSMCPHLDLSHNG